MKNISNSPISCIYCGHQVQGQESSTPTYNGIIHECVWKCTRCGNVARRDEEFEKTEAK